MWISCVRVKRGLRRRGCSILGREVKRQRQSGSAVGEDTSHALIKLFELIAH